jgi:hypothetical protein
MYMKINGRASFYKSFGCEGLIFATLSHKKKLVHTVDIEIFEMGKMQNALGVYAGERQPEAKVELVEGTMGHRARNALFLVRGNYYLRAIGSSEDNAVLSQLDHLWSETGKAIEAESLPWAYELFTARLGLAPSQVAYFPKNAFSFGFAKDVYVGKHKGGGQSFAIATKSADAARDLAQQYTAGFLAAGEKLKPSLGVHWAKENFINTISGAKAAGRMVIGGYRMPDEKAAHAALGKLERAASTLKLAEAPATSATSDNDEEGSSKEEGTPQEQ